MIVIPFICGYALVRYFQGDYRLYTLIMPEHVYTIFLARYINAVLRIAERLLAQGTHER